MSRQAGPDSEGICAFLSTTLVVKHPRRAGGWHWHTWADVLASPEAPVCAPLAGIAMQPLNSRQLTCVRPLWNPIYPNGRSAVLGLFAKPTQGGKAVIGGCWTRAAAGTGAFRLSNARRPRAGMGLLGRPALYGVSFGLEHRAKRGIFSPNETKH